MNIQDPYLRQLVENAIRGGNSSLASDLDPQTGIKRQPISPNGYTEGIQGGLTPPAPEQDSVAAQLNRLLSQKRSRFDNFNLQPVPMPTSENQRDVGARSFLSGAVHGVNARFGNKLAGKESAITNLLRLQEQKRYHDAQIGNMGTDNEVQAERLKLAQLLGQNTIGNTATDNARMQAQLDDLIRHRGVTEGQGSQRLAITVRGQDLAHGDRQQSLAIQRAREQRRAVVANAYAKLPPALKIKVDNEQSRIDKKARQDDTYDPQSDYDALDAKVLQWSQSAGTQSDPYSNPVAPGPQYGPAPIPPVAGGARAVSGIPGTGVKPSENPALPPDKRAWFKKHPQYDIPG